MTVPRKKAPVRKVVRKPAPVKKAAKAAKARPDAATNAPAGVRRQKVETPKLTEGAKPLRGDDNAVRMPHGHEQLPLDMPVYLTVHRLVNEGDNAVEGYVLSLDCFTYGRTVHVRLGKPKGWRKGHSPETTAKDPDAIKIWVNKKKIYEGTHHDEDNIYD